MRPLTPHLVPTDVLERLRGERWPSIPFAGLYACGAIEALAGTTVAIVGTRAASGQGRRLAHALAAELAGDGIAILSGLALGIDGAAHEGALSVGGATIAVLGGGH
ncbi:MAG: DNA-processing protein DprA, partial [Candidatus Baltobacteraceae bacterium]